MVQNYKSAIVFADQEAVIRIGRLVNYCGFSKFLFSFNTLR